VEQVARASGIASMPARGSSAARGEEAGEDPVRALTGLLLRGPTDARSGPGGSPVIAWIDRIEREGSSGVRSRIVELLRDASARRRVLAAAGNAALIRLWAWRRPEQRAAVTEAVEAIEALGRVLASSRHARALREAFWQFLWTGRASRAQRGPELLARFLERLARREPRLLALVRSRDAGDRIVARALARVARPAAPEAPPARKPPPASHDAGEGGERVWLVRTAGVVLVWSLLQRYFERLGLVERGAFRDVASQERACGLVHFLASGQTELREPDLVLAKVLCGLDVEAPVPVRVEVDEATRALSESLLAFLLTSWKGIGGTTVQGLRGSFLCRDGRLHRGEDEDRWSLDIERRTYDILLSSFPWQVSVVKLPWMPQPLFAHWR
jgi:hypothetical protein